MTRDMCVSICICTDVRVRSEVQSLAQILYVYTSINVCANVRCSCVQVFYPHVHTGACIHICWYLHLCCAFVGAWWDAFMEYMWGQVRAVYMNVSYVYVCYMWVKICRG